MRIGCACTHFGGHPDGLEDLLFGGAGPERLLGVDIDAIRALRGMGHRHSHQLLGYSRQRALGKGCLAEIPEGLKLSRGQITTTLFKLVAPLGIVLLRHGNTSLDFGWFWEYLLACADDWRRQCYAEFGVSPVPAAQRQDRKSTRLNSSHVAISYA